MGHYFEVLLQFSPAYWKDANILMMTVSPPLMPGGNMCRAKLEELVRVGRKESTDITPV